MRTKLELSIGNDMEELMSISEKIFDYGKKRNIDEKLMVEISLCIEEIGGNVIRHAFKPGQKRWFDLLIFEKGDSLIIRLRDNGKAFDPTQYLLTRPDDTEHYGIRLIQGMAEKIEYRRSLDLNNLMIVLKK